MKLVEFGHGFAASQSPCFVYNISQPWLVSQT